jgi:two-component system, NarL family, nitrate/nitrite response regulator NarL
LQQFQAANPHGVPVAIFTFHHPSDGGVIDMFRDCLNLSITGILLKSGNLNETFIGLERILNGELHVPQEVLIALATTRPTRTDATDYHLGLSPREWDVANGIARGLSNKVIAHELGIKEASVRQVASQVFRKLGVTNRVQAANKMPKNRLRVERR